MLRFKLGLGLAAVLLALPGAAQAEATLKILKSPVVAGEVVRLRVHVDGPLQAPLRGVSSLGSVGPFAEAGANTYEADYSPPKGLGPAMSEIAVYEDRPGGLVAYALANIADTVKMTTRVKTHEAIYVRAGSQRYGPFHPEARGELSLLFVANGEITSADLESAQGKPLGKLTLKPHLARSVAVARPTKLRAGDKREPEVLLIVAHEPALKFEMPKATITGGTIANDLKGSPEYAQRYKVTPPASFDGSLSVKFVDSLGKTVGTAAFFAAPPPVAKIQLKLPEKSLSPGERAVVDVTLLDATGNGIDGELSLDVDAGKMSPPLSLGGGLFNATFTAPAHVPEGGSVHLRAKVADSDATAAGDFAMHGGKPAKVVFHKLAQPARAGELVQVELQVFDEGGDPADAENLEVAADHGEVQGVHKRSNALFVVDVKSEADASDLLLTARDGKNPLEGEKKLSLEPASTLPFALLGVEGGFTNNFGHVSAATLTAAGHFLVGPRGTSFSGTAGFLAGYLPEVTETLTSDQSTAGTLTLSRIPLMARGGVFTALGDVGLFGGIGLGVEKLSGQLVSVGRTPLSLDAWRPAGGLYGGAGYHLGPGYLTVEVRATYATVDIQNDAVRVSGPVGGVDGALGYLIAL
ncbi:MAG: hypothetical protein JST54_22095 [Deltaproteobacteria bacterium]|nr:hypothetical protein [Deltaproteobacteria bacterium]